LQIQADKKLAKEKIIAKQNQKKIKNNKPIIVPWGIYSSRKDACNAAIKMNIEGNLIYKIAKGLKQNPEKYRYITQEEYIMMTGKEI
jgi:hypothetical protein